MLKTRRLTAFLFAAALPTAAALAGEPGVQQVKLGNGLTVLLRPIRGADRVALVVLYSIGNDHDPNGCCGLAHLTEHVYITATAGKTPARTAQQYMQRYPQGWNAQTGDDWTVIATVFPRARLGPELADAAARMTALKVAEAGLRREKQRLIAEVGNMFGLLALAPRNHVRQLVRPGPANTRRAGLPEQVNLITQKAIQARLEQYYKPANALLVLAGGFEATEGRKAVEKHFAAVPAGKAIQPARKLRAPQLDDLKEITARPTRPGQKAQVRIAFAAPGPGSPLYASFLILVQRLRTAAPTLATPELRWPVTFAPIDDPAVLYVGSVLKARETAEATVQRLQQFVSLTIRPKLKAAERLAARNAFGFLMGTAALPDEVLGRNPYGAAFGIARRHQMGVNPARLTRALNRVQDADLRRAAEAVFSVRNRAAVVARPAK